MKKTIPSLASLCLATFSLACSASTEPTLREAFKDDFLIGVALSARDCAAADSPVTSMIASQFNTATSENAMKWERIHPAPGLYTFDDTDRFVAFCQRNGLKVIGHNLLWHQQVPAWVFEDDEGNPVTRDVLLARLRDHIMTVAGRYRGQVVGWDVVNEALNEDGTLRDSPWRRIIGDDYIVKAFEYAREADPGAELYYNDYYIENPDKRAGALTIVRQLKSAGARIDGVGIQEHVSLAWPTLKELDDSIRAFAELGMKVMITELDVNVLPDPAAGSAEISRRIANSPELDPYTTGLPPEIQEQLARRYADLFGVYLKNRDVVTRVTFWGLNDRDSWLNNFPVFGRTNHPLLFDRDNKPKPALKAVIDAAVEP